ncbi:MAG: hypothetical protein ACI4V1_01465 [Eubacteriales bacterium]
MKKFLALFFTLLMTAPAFVSCASTEESENAGANPAVPSGTAEETVEPETEITRENTPDTLPELDFLGETVSIHSRGDDQSFCEIGIEEMTGEAVNDAIFERNKMVEERLNVQLNPIRAEGWEAYNNAIASLRASIMAADGAYDIIAGWSARIPSLSLEGLLLDLKKLQYLDFDQPWWNQSAVKELQIADKLHFVTGNIAKTMTSAMFVFAFNQRIVSDMGVENLYSTVREHRWTIDYVYDLSSSMYVDMDGNGSATPEDMYGLITSCVNDADSFLQGFRVSMISRDENDLPVLDVDVERMSTIVDKVYNLFWNNPGCRAHTSGLTETSIFVEGRSLFVTVPLQTVAEALPEMEDDYGVLPYPLLDETQQEYGTRVQDALSLWCVPIDAKAPDMSAAVLEALGAQSYRTVTPAYFDVALKNRYSRDAETAEMMDLIQDSALINFEQLYNESIGNPWFVLRTLMPQKSNGYASYWASNSKVIKKKLELAIKQIQALD